MRKIISLLLLLVACSTPRLGTISIQQRDFIFPVTIYPLGNETIDRGTITRKALEYLGDFRNYDSLPGSITTEGYVVTTSTSADSTFYSPAVLLEVEEYVHLDSAEIELFEKADKSIEISFFGTSNDNLKKLEAISRFIGSIAASKNVAIHDFSSHETFNKETWRKRRTESFQSIPLNIIDHIALDLYSQEEYCRIVTWGMSKFALPEIVVNNVTCFDAQGFATVLNGVAQSLYENPLINSDSSFTVDLRAIKNKEAKLIVAPLDPEVKGKATIKFVSDPIPQWIDVYPQMEIAFANKNYSTIQEEQTALLVDLVGVLPDKVQTTEHDEEMLKASELARQRLGELKKMLNDGLPPGASILLKAPFKYDDGNEWMWVEITKWTDTSIEGILQNEPNHIDGLQMGSAVTISEDEVFDYILYKQDGSMEGNETGKILEQRSSN